LQVRLGEFRDLFRTLHEAKLKCADLNSLVRMLLDSPLLSGSVSAAQWSLKSLMKLSGTRRRDRSTSNNLRHNVQQPQQQQQQDEASSAPESTISTADIVRELQFCGRVVRKFSGLPTGLLPMDDVGTFFPLLKVFIRAPGIWRPLVLDLTDMKRRESPSVGYSSLNLYRRCPMRYALSRVVKSRHEPTTRAELAGLVVHKAIDVLVKQVHKKKTVNESDVQKVVMKALVKSVPKKNDGSERSKKLMVVKPQEWKKEVANVMRQVKKERTIVEPAKPHEKPKRKLKVQTEVSVQWKTSLADGSDNDDNTVSFNGTIDRLETDEDGRQTVIEIKNRMSHESDPFQLYFYALGLWRSTGKMPVEARFVSVSNNIQRSLPVTEQILLETERQALEIVAKINGQRFEATPSATICGLCPHNRRCPSSMHNQRSINNFHEMMSYTLLPTPRWNGARRMTSNK
jgi:RecB family exonuclease